MSGVKLILQFFIFLISMSFLFQCKSDSLEFDASGTFEAKEIIVSSQVTGTIISFDAEEGDQIVESQEIVMIDAVELPYQKATLEASLAALKEKNLEAYPQVKILEEQIQTEEVRMASQLNQMDYLQKEKIRIENLLAADAAVTKQLDDILHQINQQEKSIEATRKQLDILAQQIASHRETIRIQNRGINSESEPLQHQIEMVEDQLRRARVKNPVKGTILTKYAYKGEFVTPGKALYKIADLSEMTLRAYITGEQLSRIKLGQQVQVFIDDDKESYHEYSGVVTWISDKAEFTPKTIQTKEERTNLVYAVKIRVQNDGRIKIGMFGEIKLDNLAS